MPKRSKAAAEEAPSPQAAVEANMAQEEVPEVDTRRTRSGRRLVTPAAVQSSTPAVQSSAPAVQSSAPAVQSSAPAARAPGRRTRRSVLQEPSGDEQSPEAPVEEDKSPVCDVENTSEHKTDRESDSAGAQTDEKDQKETLCQTKEMPPTNVDTVPEKRPRLALSVKQPPAVPLGKPKSGRVWKDRNKQRFSSVVRDKQLCSSWEKKMQAKREKELVKQYTQQLKDEQNRQKEEKRKRREENLKRRAENERKSEIVQVIRNTTKIKRMKKKQLRKIEKRDTLAMLQKSKDIKQKTAPNASKSIKEGPASNGT